MNAAIKIKITHTEAAWLRQLLVKNVESPAMDETARNFYEDILKKLDTLLERSEADKGETK